ncbi:carotenoid 9,10(9',10')-cleavage dioxygenase 1-like isoform X3 [Alnus glutinosa]|uniref:carotenoid 9,10(9',10')-cleavage dioxygenase 1-like isoform X3 n=1 Tax=Alnus glutinosa TaxID=3517 RepID=UPI002D7715D7|nr:carotenoid 9,10(9',10')-cleavage dioxygenase 1-like isoform X3 [Alnus glutinosa]
MTTPYTPFRVINCNIERRPSLSRNFHHLNTSLSSAFKTILRELRQVPMQIDASGTIKNASVKILDAFVDSVFEFADQPLLPSQVTTNFRPIHFRQHSHACTDKRVRNSNFAPVDELKEAVLITEIEGNIPDNFQEGVYIRNGPNPLFGRLKITKSIFGRSSHMWVEGEGMLHALYFTKASDGSWNVVYNNRHVETETFKLEKQRNKPSFLPAAEGDSPAVLSAFLLNSLRFGKVNKEMSNTNIFKHSGKLYSIAETDIPQEIDIFTLKTCNNWDVNGSWKRPFSSHPKRVPDTGELVIMGVDPIKPFFEVGVVSADGKKLIHKVDLKLKRCTLSHEIGVTQRLIKYNGEEYARIGIMPRYGDSDSIKWFEVEPSCCFHIFNSFEDDGEVVVWGCRALDSIVPGPDMGVDKFEWFSRRFRPLNSDEKNMNTSTEDGLLFSRCYEWRLNMQTGEVRERNLIGTKFSMDFPIINEHFTGVQNRFGYTQVVDSIASSTSGLAKYGGLAKLYFEEADTRFTLIKRHCEEPIKVEYHMFEANTFCTGSAFVPKHGGVEEDDGWIITFVHNEDSNTSQVYVIDTKKFSCEPVAKITLPCRVPYGFHGAFMPISLPT